MKLVRQVQASEKTHVETQKMSKSGFSLNDKTNKFSMIVEQRFKNTIMTEVFKILMKWSQRGEIYDAYQGDEQLRQDQQLLHEQILEHDLGLCEDHMKSLNEMEELKRIPRVYIRWKF